ncbi:T9SS type A sorting domain-containing protein [Carboxylicivirga sp. M1479]|uniref:T9SS type A sorting domain-containing protein n=1 Tax=Carboxylicivirga sp. M1479 TaxID=2594476 RepID=UPI0011787BDC|nr:T9SS type A sorting domain-containing protein [Carboxylicivirga sp. M1479]TRX71459.1 T9SS type A sorting domain-containing protein [Carboxylicivirga sp. M1479]
MKPLVLIALVLILYTRPINAQVSITLQVHQPPELSINAGNDTTISSGYVHTLGASPTATGGLSYYDYTWAPRALLDNPYSANPKVSQLDKKTEFYLTVDDGNCSKQDAVTISYNDYIGIDDMNQIQAQVYPTLFTNQITIELEPDDYLIYKYALLSLSGQTIIEGPIKNRQTVLNLDFCLPGHYLFVIKSANKTSAFRIVKK